MALFGRKKSSSSGNEIYDEDEILGNLDELVLKRLKLSVRTKNDNIQAFVIEVNEKNKLIRIQNNPDLDEYEGKPVQGGFSLDQLWYVFPSKLVESDGRMHLVLPKVLKRIQRRRQPRAPLTQREKVKVTALEGLGTGIGITGLGSDISVGGLCLIIERAMLMEKERDVQPRPDLLKSGTSLAVLRVGPVAGISRFEAQGKVNRIYRDGMQWKMAIEFTKVPPNVIKLLEHFISTRCSRIRPIRRSRKRRLEMEAIREQERQDKEEQKNTTAEATAEAASEAASEAAAETKEASPMGSQGISFVKEDSGEGSSQVVDGAVEPGTAPAPATEQTAAPEVQSDGETVLSIGDPLKLNLAFLANQQQFRWVHVNSPLRIVKGINEGKPHYLMTTLNFRKQSMLDYLQKIASMGILKDIDIILFHEGEIPPREVVKCRMLGIKHTFKLPLEDKELLMDILEGG